MYSFRFLIGSFWQNLKKIEYRTRAIITRGLYILNPLFEGQKRFFQGVFFFKFCLYEWLVFKSGLPSRANYDSALTEDKFSANKRKIWKFCSHSRTKTGMYTFFVTI